ncbi:MAG: site-specific DNA-methyltransferase [Campylobacterales bacterium]|nr:site-specific DNA-methyltransferase [Campylobacterales bacterium]
MELESKNLLAQKLEELKNIFPEIFDDGVINIDKFKTIFVPQSDEKSEHYSFTWSGKKECYQTIRQKSNATLKIDSSHSELDSQSNSNVFIEGDNLEVLKLLQTSYHKKIKMIYIDPPYNKDKDFVYKDTWGDTITNYLIQTDQLREEGYTSTKTSSTGRRHTNWLNMIYPRLWLSRNLLRDDGVIFVSIDDDEVHNLRKVMDEIYGEENFVANVIWEKKYSPANDAKWFSDNHDHILVYAKNKEIWRPNLLARTEEANARYKNLDNDPRGIWKASDLSVKTYSANTDYPITTPSGRVVNPPSGYSWRVSREKFNELVADSRIWFGQDGNNVPAIKRFLTDVQDGITPLTIWKYSDVGHNQEARQELNALFDGASYFDTPKPVRLIRRMLEIGSNANDEDIILDFFAGSGTTAHAVMELNQDDKKNGKRGNRKYILVQLPEAIESDKFKKISDITKDRIKRVIKKLDYKDGFKSYVLDASNFQVFKELKKRPNDSFDDIVKMLKMSIFTKNIFTQSAKEIDIVYEVGLKNGFSLSAKNESIKGEKYSFIKLYEENRAFYFCFADKVHTDIVTCIPTGAKLICFDKALDDSTKQNLREKLDLETL